MTSTEWNARGRCDKVEMIAYMDHDRGQQWHGDVRAILEKGLKDGVQGDYNLRVMDPTKHSKGRKRFKVSTWGWLAEHFLRSIPLAWFQHITRLDWRNSVPGMTERQAFALGLQFQIRKKGRHNVAQISSEYREKTDARDVGGKGFTIASRKSPTHTTVYSRGKEDVAVEVRFANRAAKDIANAFAHLATHDPSQNRYDVLLEDLHTSAQVVMHKQLRMTTATQIREAGERAERDLKTMIDALEYQEQEEERAYWESLTTEEQQDLQADGFVPVEMLEPKLRG